MKTRILIAEDDESIREMMDIVLTHAGYEVSTAAHGEAALDLLKRMPFVLVLLDVHMPRMSGLEVLEAMSRMGRTTRVLMVSANTGGDTVREAIGLGCCGYLAKPFTPKALTDRVAKTLAMPIPLVLN